MAEKIGEVFVEITARLEKLEKEFDKAQKASEKQGQKTGSKFAESFKSQLKNIGTTIIGYFAISKLASFTKEIIAQGEQLSGLQSAYKNLTNAVGLDSEIMLENMKKGTKGVISEMELMKMANNAILLGIPTTEKTMGELAEAGRRLGKAMGIDAKMGLESLVIGIGRQSKLWLDNLGLLIDSEASYSKMAKAIGKTKDELTDAEKKQAFYNATMEAVRKKMGQLGTDSMTLSDRFKALGTTIKNQAADIGKAINQLGMDSVEKDIAMLESYISKLETKRTDSAAIRTDLEKETYNQYVKQGEMYGKLVKWVANLFTKEDEINKLLEKNNIQGGVSIDNAKKLLSELEKQLSLKKEINNTDSIFSLLQIDGLDKIIIKQREYIDNRIKELSVVERIAQRNKELPVGLQQLATESEKVVFNYNRMSNFADSFVNFTSSALLELVDTNKKAFKQIEAAFKNMLARMAAEFAAKAFIFGALNALTGGGFGFAATGLKGLPSLGKYIFGAAGGADFTTNRPTLIMAGEGGIKEHVKITPAPINNNSNIYNTTNNSTPININVSANSVDENFVRFKLVPILNKLSNQDRVKIA